MSAKPAHISRTQAELCFKPLSADDIAHPVFPLFVHPYKFWCAQIPGLQPSEAPVFDIVDPENPRFGLYAIDLISFERQFLQRFDVVVNQIFPLMADAPSYNQDFAQTASLLSCSHRNYLKGLLNATQAGPDFTAKFIAALLNAANIAKKTHAEYDKLLETADGFLKELSFRFFTQFSTKLGGQTISQVMQSPASWGVYLSKFAMGLVTVLPKDPEIMKKLVAFSRAVSGKDTR
jgi:hypothetical protein